MEPTSTVVVPEKPPEYVYVRVVSLVDDNGPKQTHFAAPLKKTTTRERERSVRQDTKRKRDRD